MNRSYRYKQVAWFLLALLTLPAGMFALHSYSVTQARILSKLYGVHITPSEALQMTLFGSPPAAVLRGK